MAGTDDTRLVELGVSSRFAREHKWVVNAMTGWLSAYFMEDPRFRLKRRYDELNTGTHIWVCQITGTMPFKRLINRLLEDLPAGQVHERGGPTDGPVRYVIDVAEGTPEGG